MDSSTIPFDVMMPAVSRRVPPCPPALWPWQAGVYGGEAIEPIEAIW